MSHSYRRTSEGDNAKVKPWKRDFERRRNRKARKIEKSEIIKWQKENEKTNGN
jgi:hypothetical protein